MVKKPPAGALDVRTITIRDVGLGALLFCAALIAYLPALHGGLLWDDDAHLTRPDLQSLHGLWRIWFDLGSTQQYYPLLHSAFWLEHSLWGDAVLGYHLTNLMLHVGTALLVVMIVRRLSLPGAWLAGFIFALHPVCVEAVAWISEQKSTLSTLFYLGSAFVYLSFDQTRQRSRYALALGLFVLALLSKTVTATLPAALLLVLWWKRGQLTWKRDVLPLLPWFAIGVPAGILTAWVERKFIGAIGPDFTLTLLQRCLLAGRVIWFYLGKLLWPVNLTFIYPRWTVDPSVWWQYLFPLSVLALVAGLWIAVRRHPSREARGPLTGFLFFAGTLFPALGFFNVYPFRYSYVADHFQYAASLGILIPLACGLTIAARGIPADARRLAPLLSGVLIAVLGVLSWHQSGMYRDVETLYTETLARNPGCWMAEYNLGCVLLKDPNRLPDATAHLQAAARLKPEYTEIHDNLGLALSKVPARVPEAIAEFQTALRLKPDSAQAHTNLASTLLKIPGRQSEAMTHLEAALRIQPDSPEVQNDLGLALLKVPGLLPEAIAHLEAAAAARPDSAEVQTSFGLALLKIPERLPEAISHLETAVRIDPDSAEAQNGLGMALSNVPGRAAEATAHLEAAARTKSDSAEGQTRLGIALLKIPGRAAEAIRYLEAALRMDPDSAEAHNSLGFALTDIPGRLPEAIAHLEKALRIKPDYAEAHTNLGIALSKVPGRMPEAIAHFRQATRLNPDSASAHTNLGYALSTVPNQLPEAIEEYQKALRLDPNSAEANVDLGIALTRIPGRSSEAIAHLEAALRTRPDLEPVRQILARLRSSQQ